MKTTNKVVAIIVVICSVIIGIDSIVLGIDRLNSKKNVQNVTINEAFKILEIQTKVKKIITFTARTEYYYLGFSESDKKVYVIRAEEKWLSNNFNENGIAKNTNGVAVEAVTEQIFDDELKNKINSYIGEIEKNSKSGVKLRIDSNVELIANYKDIAGLKIVFGILLLFLIIFYLAMYMLFTRKNENFPVILTIIFIIGVVICAIICCNSF